VGDRNFKETQLKDVRPGQRATFKVDALGRPFVQRQGRQHRRRHRRAIQSAPTGERDRELREDRSASAGEDRARFRAGPGAPAAARVSVTPTVYTK
jgi:hypothetical protein